MFLDFFYNKSNYVNDLVVSIIGYRYEYLFKVNLYL